MGNQETFIPSDSRFPKISLPDDFEFNKKTLPVVGKQLKKQGVRIEKVGPIKMPGFANFDRNIHFIARDSHGKRMLIYFTQKEDPEFIDLEVFQGMLAKWGKYPNTPILVYSIIELPEHFAYYLTGKPLANVEIGLRFLYTRHLTYVLVARNKNKKRNEIFNDHAAQELIKKHLNQKFSVFDHGQNVQIVEKLARQLRKVPNRNRRMRDHLDVANKILSFIFGESLRMSTDSKWESKQNFGIKDYNIILANGQILNPYEIFMEIIGKGQSLVDVYVGLKVAIEEKQPISYAKTPGMSAYGPGQRTSKPAPPPKPEYKDINYPSGTLENNMSSIIMMRNIYMEFGLFQDFKWHNESYVKSQAQKILDEWGDRPQLTEYSFMEMAGEIMIFDTEDCEVPDGMESIVEDVLKLADNVIKLENLECPYTEEEDIMRFQYQGQDIELSTERCGGAFLFTDFLEWLDEALLEKGHSNRIHNIDFTKDQCATLMFNSDENVLKLINQRNWPMELQERKTPLPMEFLEYAQDLGFCKDWTRARFVKSLDYDLGMDNDEFLEDPYYNLANMLVYTEGFNIDHRFVSEDVVYNANKLLEPHGIIIEKQNPGEYNDPVIDDTAYLRKTALIFRGQSYDLEYIDPQDIMRLINQLIEPAKMEFLLKDVDGDCYEFILMKTELAEKLEADGQLPFSRIK